MPVVGGDYTPRLAERIATTIKAELRREYGVAIDLTESSIFNHMVEAYAESIHQLQEQQLAAVYDAAYIDTAVGEDLENVVAILGITRQTPTKATGVVQFTRNDPAVRDYPIPKGSIVQTTGATPVQFETITVAQIDEGEQVANATVRAVEGGIQGNVAAHAITEIPAGIAGVQFVDNPRPTGDSDIIDTRGIPLITGTGRESDEELRARAKATVSDGAVATTDAIYSALVNEIPEVQSVSLFVNNTYNDFRDTGGLPPVSFEAVVYGGDDTEIAAKIFDEMALTARSYGGAHGQTISIPVTASNGQTYQVQFSRPERQFVTLNITLVTQNTYIGDDAIKDIVVDYIGGRDAQGSIVYGTGVGEDVYLDTIRDLVIGADGTQTGVLGVSEIDITDGVGTSLVSESATGLEVVDIADDTIALIELEDINITVLALDAFTTQSAEGE